MEDNKMFELLLTEIREMKSDFNSRLDTIDNRLDTIESDVKEIKIVQAKHSQKLNSIYEQTGKNTELESTVKDLVDFKEYMKKYFSS